jgi:hypothetical protein
MTITRTLRRTFGVMSKQDRRLWRTAEDLDDLGYLMAKWLQGDIESQPGCWPGYGPDEETADLVLDLARLNLDGFLTTASQPSIADHGYDGQWWEQRAAVSGFARPELTARLRAAADGAGLEMQVADPSSSMLPVTRRAGQAYTWFGGWLNDREIDFQFDGCSAAALDALSAADQITIADPEWSRADLLWETLRSVR